MDCITDLDDNQSRLLEALQLSLPEVVAGNRKKRRDKKLSLNPIYRQVPRALDLCCQHLEKYGTYYQSLKVTPRIVLMLQHRNVEHISVETDNSVTNGVTVIL